MTIQNSLDRSSLNQKYWNHTIGKQKQSNRIKPLLKSILNPTGNVFRKELSILSGFVLLLFVHLTVNVWNFFFCNFKQQMHKTRTPSSRITCTCTCTNTIYKVIFSWYNIVSDQPYLAFKTNIVWWYVEVTPHVCFTERTPQCTV